MPVRKPKKPARPSRRRRASIPADVLSPSPRTAQGAGSRFMEAATREANFGHGLPKAVKPVVAITPAEIRSRQAQKEEANRRRTTANNVRGYAEQARHHILGLA